MKFRLTYAILLLSPALGFAQGTVEKDGIVSIEAEAFASQALADTRRWFVFDESTQEHSYWDSDDMHLDGASGGSYLEILPDTRTNHDEALIHGENFTEERGTMAVLSYPVYISQPGRYYVWARAYSTGGEDNGVHFGLDGAWPASGGRLQLCEGKNQWTWSSAQRRPENHCGEPLTVWLDIAEAGSHTLFVSMREDGFELDKIVLALDEQFQPEGFGPDSTLYEPTALATKSRFTGIKGYRKIWKALEHFETDDAAKVQYYREDARGALAIDAAILEYRNDFARSSKTYTNEESGTFDLTLVTIVETDGESEYRVLKNGEVIGTFKNPEVSVDFEEAYFTIPGVTLEQNDVITVEANAVTNGKVPEGDDTGYSRGRWIGVVLQ